MRGFNFAFFVIWAKLQKFIRYIFSFVKNSVVYCSILTGFACDHGPAEVFSVQSRSLPDSKRLLSSTVRSQVIDSAYNKVSAYLASDSSAKDRPSRGLYTKFLPEQTAQVARYTMKSRNKRTIAKLSSSGASISRKVQSRGGSRNTRKYCNLIEAL